MPAWIDEKLDKYYRLVRVLKKTEKSEILHLRHITLEKDIVKRIQAGNAEVYDILRRVSHPNIPKVYEVVTHGPDTIILEEFIHGITVSQELQGKLFSENDTRSIVRSLCGALSAIHSLGIIHRDIKPEHVIIGDDGVVTLIDYDTARLYKPYRTADTHITGTTGYAAPEQFGLTQSDERTDIFSLGILMNVMLTGAHPSQKLYGGKLTKTIEKCTQIDPNKRYGSAFALAKELR